MFGQDRKELKPLHKNKQKCLLLTSRLCIHAPQQNTSHVN